jgi:ectoine hydroxylase-related dioxygenase (phytanoyl-CoA dioxygenase family)
MNFYLPFTKAYGTNTIWVESEEDKKDFSDMKTEYGECIRWDGANLTHGNKQNLTNTTRISVDFRVIPYSRYKPSNHGSINTKTKFEIGGYYKKI